MKRVVLATALALSACVPPGGPVPNAPPRANASVVPFTADACVPTAAYRVPGTLKTLTASDMVLGASRARVVLLGEAHDNPDHHHWQLQTLIGLHAQRPDMVIGLEMLPRRVQPVLDKWVQGELSEADFLKQAGWSEVWQFDSQLYMPILHFARLNRIPLVALNVDRSLVAEVGRNGWESIPAEKKEGVGTPASPPPQYVAALMRVFAQHGGAVDNVDNPMLRRFIEAQTVWDRAMAEALAAKVQPNGPLVVGLMGMGHLEYRNGVPHQLASLQIPDALVMLPWDAERPCTEIETGIADAVFGLPASPKIVPAAAVAPAAPSAEPLSLVPAAPPQPPAPPKLKLVKQAPKPQPVPEVKPEVLPEPAAPKESPAPVVTPEPKPPLEVTTEPPPPLPPQEETSAPVRGPDLMPEPAATPVEEPKLVPPSHDEPGILL